MNKQILSAREKIHSRKKKNAERSQEKQMSGEEESEAEPVKKRSQSCELLWFL